MPRMSQETLVPRCSICGELYHGIGNNAEPVNNGRCCNTCNDLVVIPIRITQMRKDKQQESPPTD